MKSLIIGIARTGTAHNQVLNPDTRYLSMCGNAPEVTFSINCGQDVFYSEIANLRYSDPTASDRAISYFQNLATTIFNDIKFLKIDNSDTSPLHIRLVVSPLELAQIPFEFVLSPEDSNGEGIPLLTHPKRTITLTREVRQESEARYIWPHKPRILFAWAQPTASVPHEEHLRALMDLLKPLAKPKENLPYPEPDLDPFLTVLPDASIHTIAEEIRNGVSSKNPYTHIHILAHGGHVNGFAGYEFRLILCKKGSPDKALKHAGEDLIKAFIPNKDFVPTVISLNACDTGNTGNTIVPSGSLMQQLHNAGIPCVFASQFPLTKTGSVKLVKTLYHEMVNACDPRTALYVTRMALKQDQSHDWASLVAYARFPDDINEQLYDARLKLRFATMKATNAGLDHVFKYMPEIPVERRGQALGELETRLNRSIVELSLSLDENRKSATRLSPLLLAEHVGLLASAYKRKAEYLFRLIDLNPEKKIDLTRQSTDALMKAKDFYREGFDSNPTNHWNAGQYLSLKLVSEGTLEDENEIWTLAKYMAERDEKNAVRESDRIWSWGTLAELYMLKPFILPGVLEAQVVSDSCKAKLYMNMLAQSSDLHTAEKESTAQQLDRYIHWWPKLFRNTFPEEVKNIASELRSMLPNVN